MTRSDVYDHELVEAFADSDTGLRGIVAIHSTSLGPAMGGLRIAAYDSVASMERDARRLSRTMTMKNAVAGLPLGGGKAVLVDDGEWGAHRRERLLAFAQILNGLDGSYITAEDSGTTAEDMAVISTVSPAVAGKPVHGGGRGDPSPYTARTVFAAIEAAVTHRFGFEDLDGVRVGVLGAGAVGSRLAALLAESCADVLIADVIGDRAEAAAAMSGATVKHPNSLLCEQLDVLAPCALGGVIDTTTVADLRCAIVAGAANNPLADESLAQNLHDSGILYVPDFIANCGGIIHVGAEAVGLTAQQADDLLDSAITRSTEVLASAADRGVTPLEVAYELAAAKLSQDNATEDQ